MTKRDERGQALVFTVISLTVLLGMAAFVLDVGSWFRADRRLQATVDAAALAGAQALPEDPGTAAALAVEYGDLNGGDVGSDDVSFESTLVANDTIRVQAEAPAPGFFSSVFGLASVEVGATAKARAGKVSSAKYVAPITVSEEHPRLKCKPLPCSEPTWIEQAHLHKPKSGDAAGAFGLLNLRGGSGTAGADEVAEWMAKGFNEYMPLGTYYSVPSAMFNSSQFQSALDLRIGTEVLFPVYRPPIKKSGSTAEYDIIGWVGFTPSHVTGGGDNQKVHGTFGRVVWEGILAESGGEPEFGVTAIELIE